MGELNLDAIKALADAATPGPWTVADGHLIVGGEFGYRIPIEGTFIGFDPNFIARARADVPDLLAETKRLREQIQRVMGLHSEYRIYTECSHQHAEGESGVVEANEVGLVCADGYLYSVCRTCCTEDDQNFFQTEECADAHDHSASGGGWRCETRIALDGEEAASRA